jgi:hypothetical protein
VFARRSTGSVHGMGRCLLALVVLVGLWTEKSHSKERTPTVASEAWTIDLRPMGYAFDESAPPEQIEASRDIAFGDGGEVVVLGGKPNLDNPYTVTGFVLNAKGELVRTQAWTARYSRAALATDAGGYAVLSMSGLVLYSAGLERVVAENARGATFASPTGRTLGVRSSRNGKKETVLLDSKTLQERGVAFRNNHNVESISDMAITYSTYLSRSPLPVVQVEDGSGVVGSYEAKCGEVHSRFLADDAVLVLGCGHMDVMSIRGERLFRESTSRDAWLATVARGGRRFAMARAVYERGRQPKLDREEFIIYDIPGRKAVTTLHVTRLRGRRDGRSGAALAANGTALAVNSLGIVSVYKLPE